MLQPFFHSICIVNVVCNLTGGGGCCFGRQISFGNMLMLLACMGEVFIGGRHLCLSCLDWIT